MKIGRMDRKITIQSVSESRDSFGQAVPTYSTLATVWAHRMDVRAQERFQARQELAVRTATYRIRWRSGLTEKMRVVDDGTTYDITGIAGDRRQGWMELACEAIGPAAEGAG